MFFITTDRQAGPHGQCVTHDNTRPRSSEGQRSLAESGPGSPSTRHSYATFLTGNHGEGWHSTRLDFLVFGIAVRTFAVIPSRVRTFTRKLCEPSRQLPVRDRGKRGQVYVYRAKPKTAAFAPTTALFVLAGKRASTWTG